NATTATRQVGAATTRVDYSGVEDLAILAGGGNDTLTVTGAPSAAGVQFAAGNGSDTLVGAVAGNVFDVSGTDAGRLTFPGSPSTLAFTATENLRAQAATTIRLGDGSRLTGVINGGGL